MGEKLREGAVSSESVLEVDCCRRREGREREGRRYVAKGVCRSEGILSARYSQDTHVQVS